MTRCPERTQIFNLLKQWKLDPLKQQMPKGDGRHVANDLTIECIFQLVKRVILLLHQAGRWPKGSKLKTHLLVRSCRTPFLFQCGNPRQQMRKDAPLHSKPETTTGDFHCRASTEGSRQIFPRVLQQEIGDHSNIHLSPPSLNFYLLQWQMEEWWGKEMHYGGEKGWDSPALAWDGWDGNG